MRWQWEKKNSKDYGDRPYYFFFFFGIIYHSYGIKLKIYKNYRIDNKIRRNVKINSKDQKDRVWLGKNDDTNERRRGGEQPPGQRVGANNSKDFFGNRRNFNDKVRGILYFCQIS